MAGRRGRRKLMGANGNGGGPPNFNLGLPRLGRKGKRGGKRGGRR